jgi:diadenosine tetraphosphate (Ap4A) HIT family hydrolase
MKYETLKEAQAADVAPWDLEVDRLSDFHVAVFQDRYPVAPGHLLFVPQ